MEYRSYDASEFNGLNQSVVEDQDQLDIAMANIDHYIRRGKAERAQVTLAGLRAVKNTVIGLFA